MAFSNLEIKQLVKDHRLFYYEIAAEAGISPETLCRYWRTELSLNPGRYYLILGALDRLTGGDYTRGYGVDKSASCMDGEQHHLG